MLQIAAIYGACMQGKGWTSIAANDVPPCARRRLILVEHLYYRCGAY
jgi:hypothetical protein